MDDLPEATPAVSVADLDLAPSETINLAPGNIELPCLPVWEANTLLLLRFVHRQFKCFLKALGVGANAQSQQLHLNKPCSTLKFNHIYANVSRTE